MRRKLTLGLLAFVMSATALISVAHRAEAQICPLCVIGKHCCIVGGQAACFPDSNPCT